MSSTASRREDVIADVTLVLLVMATAGLVGGSHWLAGTDVLVPMLGDGAVFCLLLARVAPRGTTYWLAAEAAAVAALFIFTATHRRNLIDDFPAWIQSIRGSVVLAALVTMAGAGWMVVAWSAFWVARRRNAALALVPLGVVLAVEILNDPAQRAAGPLMVAWILLAGVLLLRLNAARIRQRWRDRVDAQVGVQIASKGAAAGVALLIISVLLPPLSTTDLSVALFRGRNPSGTVGPAADPGGRASDSQGGGNLARTGYTEVVAPGGSLARSSTPVLRVSSDFGRSVYWRGINLYSLVDTAWLPGSARAVTAEVGPNTPLDDAPVTARQHVHATVEVLDVPQQTLFWPGDPYLVDQATVVRGPRPSRLSGVASVEAAYSRALLPVGTTYTVEALQSVATEDQLRQAGTNYPAAVLQLTGTDRGVASGVGADVAELAHRVAGPGVTPYEQVKNVESYLRRQERYQLAVASPPPGADPVSYFLFHSHTGYCEYFASSMGEMVRALGIPVRLVSGYGPGQAILAQDVDRNLHHDATQGSVVSTIRASDAHTWVEVYFPGYGWIPFEPTPDPNYPALTRGQASASSVPLATAVPSPSVLKRPVLAPRPGSTRVPAALGLVTALVIALGLLAFTLSSLVLGPARGADLGAAWNRLGLLGRRLGVTRRDSDTPLEYSRRLAARLPGLGPELMLIGAAYSRDQYSAGLEPNERERERASEAWRAVRAQLLRLLTLGRSGRVVSPGAAVPPS